ncbi:MAG: YqzL family protein [Clostridia bacterium]|nr:YqzL family protein [Clostridia bacterium]
MRKKPDEVDIPVVDPVDTTWQLFRQTGNLNYYMLYKNLINSQEKHKK